MQVFTFRAESVQAAFQQVRQALGSEACVLHTREKRESVLGFFSKTFIEVEATLDLPVPSRLASANAAGQSHSQTPQHHAPQHHSPRRQQAQPLPQRPVAVDSISSPNVDSARTAPRPAPAEPTSHSSFDQVNTAQALKQPINRTEFSPAMLEIYTDLVSNAVPDDLARELLLATCESESPAQCDDSWSIHAALTRQLIAKLRVSGPIELNNGQQQVVALVGPTGVGKTTTLAKIAAGFRFDLGTRVGLIALDTFRLGAVDQLLQYAELISADLEVVSSPEQVTPALQRLRDCDLVLLDTAGRSPRDAAQLSELQKFLAYAAPQSTQLVVSATSSAAYLEEVVERFAPLNPTNLLITKIDEAVNLGNWLGALRSNKLPVSYLTNGQHVPQDIVVASARRLASLLLGTVPQ